VVVRDEVERLLGTAGALLQLDVLLDSAEVVAEVKRAARLDAGDSAHRIAVEGHWHRRRRALGTKIEPSTARERDDCSAADASARSRWSRKNSGDRVTPPSESK
jgi:hypothetical protein